MLFHPVELSLSDKDSAGELQFGVEFDVLKVGVNRLEAQLG